MKQFAFRKKETYEFLEDFPIDGEAYEVGKYGDRYYFAWGPDFPFAGGLPSENILDGASGIEWFNTEQEARARFEETKEAVNM